MIEPSIFWLTAERGNLCATVTKSVYKLRELTTFQNLLILQQSYI